MSGRDVMGQMGQQLRAIASRMRHVFHRAWVSAPANESGGTQLVQVVNFQGEVVRDVRSAQHYGFASSPLVGCELFIVHANGDSSSGYAVASNDQRHRPRNMSSGSTMLYNDGHTQVLLVGKKLFITAAEQVEINSPKLIVKGDIEATGDVKAGSVSLKQHRHINTQPGTGQSGIPQT